MKSLNEANNSIKNIIKEYQLLCITANNKLIGNTCVFFNNLIPFTKHQSGPTGYQLSVKFLNELEIKLHNNSITSTEQLINFAKQYTFGPTLKKFIDRAIREIAGFHHGHIDYLISTYQNAVGRYNHEECKKEIEALIISAIHGEYQPELYKYIGDYIGLTKVHQLDYGAKLLECLNKIVGHPQHKLDSNNHHYYKHSN